MGKLQFKNIKREGKIGKQIIAEVISMEEIKSRHGRKLLIIILGQQETKIKALAFFNCRAVKNVLKEGDQVIFPEWTFKAKTKNTQYYSESTCDFDLIFVSVEDVRKKEKSGASGPSSHLPAKTCEFQTLQAQINEKKSFTSKLSNVKLVGGEIYRYMGCEFCTTCIRKPRPNGKFYCEGNCKEDRKWKKGVESKLKMCMILKNVSLQGNCGHVVENLVIFDKQCSELFGKRASDFIFDDEANNLFRTFADNSYSLRVTRGQQKMDSLFPPSLKIHQIAIQIGDLDNFQSDGNIDFGKKKKKTNFPILVDFEVKINIRSDPKLETKRSKLNETYTITSRSPGAVLLINNKLFPHHLEEEHRDRKGSDKDVYRVQALVKTMGYLLFEDTCFENIVDREALSQLFERYKKMLVKTDCDVALIIIMSHGANGEICLTGRDHNTNKANVMDVILDPFSNKNFLEFIGKPKIFINEACQSFSTSHYTQALRLSENRYSDILFCQSSLPGFKSYRSEQNGCIYIYYLVKNICQHAYYVDFESVLKLTERDIHDAKEQRKAYEISTPYHYGIAFSKLYLLPFELTSQIKDEDMDIN